ncbi:sensor histidine kinase [Clostridium beijerinckii]|jgi:Osmosensitive K+ channel histidine kinase|uniref:histidine kinase n=2 Tax=Clostridium beijerinckii TaxID=1520 RepID=A0AAE2RU18_CLOBE|nr:HAMP domain-containing sensor histidine kinase [Clostridium beijerinckii]ABR35783.1 histidine kinase [Clostridium beijerinckii NCIMB 8052]AIU01849.1 histidine kinase [Clostridium beijerinckii ATCC 35702]MBC2458816.1 HAMP domain-containing histidine kinase [Clostridium beijerinckii]MBC2476214.1 HAMP domain-containing histidine kinase [Clostridium beijerinckii]MBF7809579.1 HAMP domain-containing histidine kinase [Clostridium beijerinckii]
MIIILILSIVIILLISYIFHLKLQIKSIGKQLENISEGKTEKKIDISLLDKDIEYLAGNINRNINSQKQLRIEMLRNEQKLKDSIANISHDLRTPLTSIIGYLQLLEKSKLSEDQREKINIIKRKSEILHNLITSFFEITIIENDRMHINLEKINMNNFLSDAMLQNIMPFKEAGIEPIFDLPNTTIFIEGDKIILQRIVQNLISNILKYGSSYVKISLVKKEHVELCFANKIEDPKKIDVNLLFEKFYTGDKSRSSGSTGLGLSIVKLLAERINAKALAEIKEDILTLKIVF